MTALCSSPQTTQSIKVMIFGNTSINQYINKVSLSLSSSPSLPVFLPMVKKDKAVELIFKYNDL
jgi:hypothetical protein